MAAISREQVHAPILQTESVLVPSLGGDVLVRGLMLSQQLALSALVLRESEPRTGETAPDAEQRAKARRIVHTLAASVVLDDDRPLFSTEEWELFGSSNPGEALTLYQVAQRLSGQDPGAAAKNSEPSPS